MPTQISTQEPVITLTQAADILDRSESTTRRYIADHAVKPALVGRGPGGKHLYRVSDIERLRDRLAGHAYAVPEQEQAHPTQVIEQEQAVVTHEQATPNHAYELLSQALASLGRELEAARERETRIIAERDAERSRADAAQAETQRERDMRLRAEWEAAQHRPLTAPPAPLQPQTRRWRLPWRRTTPPE